MGAVLIIVFYMGNQSLYNTQVIPFENIGICEEKKQEVINSLTPELIQSPFRVVKTTCVETTDRILK